MCVYNWVTFLYRRNSHNIVKQLHFRVEFFFKKRKDRIMREKINNDNLSGFLLKGNEDFVY